MPLRVLDLNDWELSLYCGDSLEVQLPGFALIEPKRLVFGEEALAQHRRSPLITHSSYWYRLDASPLRSGNRQVLTGADLVFNQLKALIGQGSAEGERVLLAVPSHYSNDQLAVLLGIVEQTPIRPMALVDSLVACATTDPGDFVLDVSLNEMTIVRLGTSNGLLQRVTVESVPDGGLLPILDAWLAQIADEFVRETRFDPLRIAETEQQLWSRVYSWLRGEVSALDYGLHLEVNNKTGSWHVNFDVRQLEALTASLAKTAVSLCAEVPNARLRLTSRAARIPGLAQGIHGSGISDCSTLADDSLVRGLAGNLDYLEGGADEGLRFVTSLRVLAKRKSTSEEPNPVVQMDEQPGIRAANETGAPATHLVIAGVAYQVSESMRLADLIPNWQGSNDVSVSPGPSGVDIHRTTGGSEEFVRSLGCGEVALLDGSELLAIRLAPTLRQGAG